MTESAAELKSCDPQLIDADAPSRGWGLDRLSAAAVDAYRKLLGDERFLTQRYWRLGQLLCLARKEFHRGQWEPYLNQLEIDKTRATKAMRIYETFATEQATTELTVAEAYDRRQRRPRTLRPTAQAAIADTEAEAPHPMAANWPQFANSITAAVEQRLEEAEFCTANEAAVALAEVRRAMTSLRRLEEKLHGLGGQETAKPRRSSRRDRHRSRPR